MHKDSIFRADGERKLVLISYQFLSRFYPISNIFMRESFMTKVALFVAIQKGCDCDLSKKAIQGIVMSRLVAKRIKKTGIITIPLDQYQLKFVFLH